MKFTRTLSVILCAAALLPVGATIAAAQAKIAVVDLQRALNETEDGQQAKKRLKKLFDQRQTSLDGAQKKLEAQKNAIEKQKDVLSEDALRKKLEAYQKDYMALQQQYMEYQQELAKKESELTQRILEKMQDILRQVGEKEGYTLIVEANEGGVVWAPTSINLTERVIKLYNQGAKSKK
ncbi:MAG: OmpH family outer membrane protein [Polyangiales bacterium]